MWYRNHHVKMTGVVVMLAVMSRTRRLVLIARLLRPHCGEVDQLGPRCVCFVVLVHYNLVIFPVLFFLLMDFFSSGSVVFTNGFLVFEAV